MVYIILPIHNEAQTIIKTASELFSWCEKHLGNYRIVFVNDHSTDGLHRKLTSIKDIFKFIVLDNKHNPGKGSALRYGFELIENTFNLDEHDDIIFMDGDGQIDPRNIRALFNIMNLYDADAVIANKKHLYSLTEYSHTRSMISNIFNFITRHIFKIPFTDTQCGLKIFKYSALAKVIDRITVCKFAFDVELILALRAQKFRVVDAPITLNAQLNSGSVNITSVFETLKDTGRIYINCLKSFYKGASV